MRVLGFWTKNENMNKQLSNLDLKQFLNHETSIFPTVYKGGGITLKFLLSALKKMTFLNITGFKKKKEFQA